MRVIDGQHMASILGGSARARIGEISVAVKTGAVPMRFGVLDAQEIVVAEAVIDLDVELVVGVRARAALKEIGRASCRERV